MVNVIRPLENSVSWFVKFLPTWISIGYFMLKTTKSKKMCVFEKYSKKHALYLFVYVLFYNKT